MTSTSEAHGKQALTESSQARKTHEPCVLEPTAKQQINVLSESFLPAREPSRSKSPRTALIIDLLLIRLPWKA